MSFQDIAHWLWTTPLETFAFYIVVVIGGFWVLGYALAALGYIIEAPFLVGGVLVGLWRRRRDRKAGTERKD